MARNTHLALALVEVKAVVGESPLNLEDRVVRGRDKVERLVVVADGAVPGLGEGAVNLNAVTDVHALLAVLDLAVDVRVLPDGGLGLAVAEDEVGAVGSAVRDDAEVGEGGGRDGVGGPLLQRASVICILRYFKQVQATHSRDEGEEGSKSVRGDHCRFVCWCEEGRSYRRC